MALGDGEKLRRDSALLGDKKSYEPDPKPSGKKKPKKGAKS